MSDPLNRRRRLADARLYLVAPARIAAGRLADLIPALARGGVDLVQLRDRSLTPEALLAEARACASAAAASGVLFIVNDDPALARAAGADGVHIGQDDGSVEAARALLGAGALVGRSTRGGDLLARAAAEGADYASVGPVWETPTKPGRAPIGLRALADAAREARVPWFAIGAIDARRALRVGALGATRAVCVRAIVDADDPAAAAARIRDRLVGALPRVLTIAGSDSGGGAGIQADVKANSRAGGFPLCALTALTAQSTLGVDAVMAVEPGFIIQQVATVLADIGLDGVKTGMLGSAAAVEAAAQALAGLDPADEVPVVVDPVLRAESGAPLMARGGEEALRRQLLPLASVITPNLVEAQALADSDRDDAGHLARALHERHGCAVIVTGGHGATSADVLCDPDGVMAIPGPRLPRATTHGAGCTHSSTLAALLARGLPLREAAAGAKRAATAAVRGGRPFGEGAGPVDVMAGAPWR
ncbi:MAG: hydroxymethylpyrimidine/phosphomethylpyrimidine kinase [Miltoncostaeaceae bacterium]|nr:hydroxymethylpyrimidine/phosphomethylpyrimidine kinase [Miltoncostaeaceae bacterium]